MAATIRILSYDSKSGRNFSLNVFLEFNSIASEMKLSDMLNLK